eukprot:182792-Prorocentrum_lima.AAC.1
MAADIGGNTLHAVLGLNHILKRDDMATRETATRLSRLRWLVLDEISMVSARLLGKVDTRLTRVAASAGPFARDPAGKPRPFGGLNVLLLGDFWQLPPPDGGNLATTPPPLLGLKTAAREDPLVAHGRDLLWFGPTQGLTELTEVKRCDDV